MSVEAKTTSSEVITADPVANNGMRTTAGPYRLYKRRWFGVFAMVSTPCFFIAQIKLSLSAKFMLEAVAAAAWPWFGPISNNGAMFDYVATDYH